MDRIRNSNSSSSDRNVPRFNRSSRKTECLHPKALCGLLPRQFMPMGHHDLMTFYVERKANDSTPTEDIDRLFEQLNNVEEKVKAMEELLGGVRRRNLNVLPVHEDYDERRSSDQHRKKMSHKRRKGARCLCFPWGCRPEASESVVKKKSGKPKSDKKPGGADALQHASRGSKVSWDEDITVRYIGSSEDVLRNVPNRKNKSVQRESDEDLPNASINEDDVKDVVHVKIRIPKYKKESASNIIEITGENIEATDDLDEVDEDLKNTILSKAIKLGKDQEDAIPVDNVIETDDRCLQPLEPSATFLKSTNKTRKSRELHSKNEVKKKPPLERSEEQYENTIEDEHFLNDSSETDIDEERGRTPNLWGTPESSRNSEPKKCTAEVISESNKASEHRTNSYSRRKLSGRKSSTDRTTETKIIHGSKRPSAKKRDTPEVRNQSDERTRQFENHEVKVDPIAFFGRPDRVSERSVGIPVKEPGRLTCGSLDCKCKGSLKNDGNLYELKKSFDFNESDISLLDNMMEKSADPQETSINTDFGTVNVVTHKSNCSCIICQTFGSHGERRKNSVRSDTGAIVSKRVVRVRYDGDFRNILTHTEECGCALCIRIDEHMYKNRSRRSTQISTKDSFLMVQNKGVCGCTDCKTVTINKPSTDVEELMHDFDGVARYMKTMVSRTNCQSVDPCFYSDATAPSIDSFPPKEFIAYQNQGTIWPSIDNWSSSEGGVSKKLKFADVTENPRVRQVSLKRCQQQNNSLTAVSTKSSNEHEESDDSVGSDSNMQLAPPKRWRRHSNKTSDSKKMEYQYKNSETKQDAHKEPIKHSQNFKRKRNKVREVRMYNKDWTKPEDVSGLKKRLDDSKGSRKSYGNTKRVYRKVECSRKHPIKTTHYKNESDELDDPQMTLEEIIKDLVSGQSDVSGNKTYTVTLGKIHDKPYTKVKIIDCSKPQIDSCSSILSAESQVSQKIFPLYNQNSSNSAVYFLKSLPSISVSPTRSSNFARSGETSLVAVSHSILRNDKSESTPLHFSRQSISRRPSLFILSPIKEYERAEEVNESVENNSESQAEEVNEPENKIITDTNNVENRSPSSQDSSPSILRQRAKTSKFTIKLSGKVCSLFKRNFRKNTSSVVTNANSMVNE